MLQEQYNILKRNNKLEKKIILEDLLQKGLSSVRNKLNNVGESSKSGNSSSQKDNDTTSLRSQSPKQTSEPSFSRLIDIRHVLYQDSLKLHTLYTEKKRLSPQEKKRMALGLSCILDFNDDGQALLFGENDWTLLKRKYTKLYKLANFSLAVSFAEKWSLLFHMCISTNSVLSADQYMSKLLSEANLVPSTRLTYKLFSTCLDIFENNQLLLNPMLSKKNTEYDYILNIWGPLFKKIFSINNNIIRIKCGESVSDCMKKGKEELYPGDSNVVSFKVDLRFLHDDDEFEIDLATVECSKPNSDDEKNERDSGKLCRESKDSLDTIWDLLKDFECDVKTWSLQISGTVGVASTTHYTQNGFYVVIPRFHFYFPTSFASMADFIDVLNNLLMIRNDIEKTAHYLQHVLKSNQSSINPISQRFEDATNMESPPHLSSSNINTYYTPPRNDATRSNAPLFEEVSDPLIDITDIASDTSTLDSQEGEEEERDGFKKQSDGSWFHIATGVRMTCNPFE